MPIACSQHLLLPLLVTCSMLSAQTTWVVPNGADPDLYIAQASPGDTLQLSAQHPGFTLDKGMTVIGPSSIRDLVYPYTQSAVQIAIPAGQRARFFAVGFLFSGGFTGPGMGGNVHVDGDVSFEDCNWVTHYVGGAAVPAALTVSSGSVQLLRCNVYGAYDGNGLYQTGGICSLTNSLLQGGEFTADYYFVPKPGIRQDGGTLVASKVTLRGGRGGSNISLPTITIFDAAPAMVQNGGVAWLSDSELRGGDASLFSFAKAGPAMSGYGQVFSARNQLIDGTSQFGLTGPTTGDVADPAMVGISMPAPLQLGQSYSVVGTAGNSLEVFGIVGAFDLATTQGGILVEPLYGTIGTHVTLALAAPGVGQQVTVNGAVPNVPALIGAAVWFQALQLHGAQLRLSAVVGGTVR